MAQFQNQVKKIAVFTSGGDAPGMNAAIRAVVRISISQGLKVDGIIGGYSGMLNNEFVEMNLRSVANSIQRGGTLLKTGRCMEFHKPEFRKKALQNLKQRQVDGVVCIGGDGSFRGALAMWEEHQIPFMGIPGTIDNDIYGTSRTIGFDTAVNTALDAIDRIRDTAASHDRLFIIEVMGRDSGYIAAHCGLAGGAEEILTPEYPIPVDKVVEKLQSSQSKGKKSSIIVSAEGQKPGRAYDLAEQIRKKSGIEAKVCILGHQQRGGAPTASDRILASRLGAAAVQSLIKGQCNMMAGVQGDQIVLVPFDDAVKKKHELPRDYIDLSSILAL